MNEPSKIGGAASQVCSGEEGASAKTQLSLENKNVSSFCEDCKSVSPGELPTSYRIFIDRQGLAWLCSRPLTCQHSIVLNGAIASCRVRTAQLNLAEKGLIFI